MDLIQVLWIVWMLGLIVLGIWCKQKDYWILGVVLLVAMVAGMALSGRYS